MTNEEDETEEKVKELIEEAIADACYSNSCTTCPIVANNLKIASELLEKYFKERVARDAQIKELLEQIKKDSHGGVIYINAQEALSLLEAKE
jgi:hypothetical protein